MLRSGRKILCLMLILAVLMGVVPASASVKARVKSSSAKLYHYPTTSSAGVRIKKGATVTVKAVKGGWAKVKCKGVSGYMKASALGSAKRKSTSWKKKVVKMNWYDGGSSVLKKDHYGYIYDIDTGVTVRIKRMGGSNHADCEPATKADTAKLLKIAGGHFSWDSHAVILHAGGKYVACAINTYPHGDQTIRSNGYSGQFCLHMLGSKTHGSDSVNSDHQAAIRRAYNWAH